MKKKAIIAIILVFSLLFFSCSNIQEHTKDSNSNANSNNTMTKHEVELTMDNYLVFLNVEHAILRTVDNPAFTFEGCLSYAFYSEVVVSVEYIYSQSSEIVEVALNASGKGFAPHSKQGTTRICGISGSVIYWI